MVLGDSGTLSAESLRVEAFFLGSIDDESPGDKIKFIFALNVVTLAM